MPEAEHTRRFYETLRLRTGDGKVVRLKEKVGLAGKLESFREGGCAFRVRRI